MGLYRILTRRRSFSIEHAGTRKRRDRSNHARLVAYTWPEGPEDLRDALNKISSARRGAH